MKKTLCIVCWVLLVLSFCACGNEKGNGNMITCSKCLSKYDAGVWFDCPWCTDSDGSTSISPSGSSRKLSDECGYILSSGTDNDGNFYELVANQTESATGYNIEVGVIKNNQWIYPLSSDFPFLNSKGLFTIGGKSVSLSRPSDVIGDIYFVDNGGFMLEDNRYDRIYRDFFDCNTLKMISDCFTGQRTLLYRYERTKYKNYGDYGIESFGKIYTDDGLLCITDWDKNNYGKYVVEILDLNNQTCTTIASGLDYFAQNGLYEGLIFASNNAFYDTKWNKVIDLSMYDIITFNSPISFKNGRCTFVARNDIGTKFNVTIDKSGNVISETKID